MVAKLSIAAALSSLLLSTSVNAWLLQSTLSGSGFFDGFSYFTGGDPTHGFVQYLDQSTAQSSNLVYTQNGQVIIKADNTTVTPNGRPSVRIVSNASYNKGLFLLDLEHMPTGCGTWPAFWMVGPNWPNSGEIDVSKLYLLRKEVLLIVKVLIPFLSC
jgi:beta-glucanase (GH16 family)